MIGTEKQRQHPCMTLVGRWMATEVSGNAVEGNANAVTNDSKHPSSDIEILE